MDDYSTIGVQLNGAGISVNLVTPPEYISGIQGGQLKLTTGVSLLKSLSQFGLPIQPTTHKKSHPTYFSGTREPRSIIPMVSPR